MINPFKPHTFDDAADLELIESALNGSKKALESLVKRHQHYIYNIALKLVLSPFDAEDITQEVLIKMVTKLSQFQGKSKFRSWLYRITFNHFLSMKKYPMEEVITTFDAYGDSLDSVEDEEMTAQEQVEKQELITEAKLGCMSGMLLCLNREQRLVYILGEIFEADHNIGSELLGITKANYRKRLERARKDLHQFLNNKCGLINKNNPCRCARKTSGFIKKGWVDKNQMRFNIDYIHSIRKQLQPKTDQLHIVMEDYQTLYQDMPFQEKKHATKLMQAVLMDSKVQQIFNLN